MEIAELVLKYIQALSWPIVILVLIWCLRRHLAGAIARLSRVDTPAGSMEFTYDAQATQEVAAELEAERGREGTTDGGGGESGPPAQEAGVRETPDELARLNDRSRRRHTVRDFAWVQEQLDRLFRSVQRPVTPAQSARAVNRGWTLVGAAVGAAWRVVHHGDGRGEPGTFEAMRELVRAGVSPTAERLLRDLDDLHERVALSLEEPGSKATRDYLRSCQALVGELDAFMKQPLG
ncbi:hypothetical protein ACQ5JZ_05440 [Streptomyces sp. ZG43]